MKILLSGFSSFSDHAENSSEILALLLEQERIEGLEINAVILPVTFKESFEILKMKIESFKPDVIISLGLAEKRSVISLEKVALNYIDCRIPDNNGELIKDSPILEEAALAYFSTLPIKEMLKVQTPYPVEISYSAGTYVCNYLMYKLLNYCKNLPVLAGFIHVPHLDHQKKEILNSMRSILIQLQNIKNCK